MGFTEEAQKENMYQIPPPYYEVYHGSPPEDARSTADIIRITPEEGRVHLFSVKSIRIGFMRKVFGILALQILVTFGIIALFVLFKENLDETVFKTPESFGYTILGFVIADIVCIVTVGCKPVWIRNTGVSFLFLALITLFTAIFVGMIASLTRYKDSVFFASGMTLTVVILLTLFTLCQSKYELDFCVLFMLTTLGVVVAGFAMCYLVPYVVSSPYEYSGRDRRIFQLIVGGIVTVIFGMFWIWIVPYLLVIFGIGNNNGGSRGGMPIFFWYWFPVWVDDDYRYRRDEERDGVSSAQAQGV